MSDSSNRERHFWTEEDDILALELYFREGAADDAHPEVAKTLHLIDPSLKSAARKFSNFCYLNHLDLQSGMSGRSTQLQKIWNEYCYDDKWMLWKLRETPGCSFAEACRDIGRLQRDARAIIRRRTAPSKVSRREARRALMNILYAARLQNLSAADSLLSMSQRCSSAREKMTFADSMLCEVIAAADAQQEEIEKQIAAAAERAPDHISAVEYSILRAAVAELLSQPQTGREVIINEAVEIAKQFGADGGHKIVNGVLDKIATSLRGAHARK